MALAGFDRVLQPLRYLRGIRQMVGIASVLPISAKMSSMT